MNNIINENLEEKLNELEEKAFEESRIVFETFNYNFDESVKNDIRNIINHYLHTTLNSKKPRTIGISSAFYYLKQIEPLLSKNKFKTYFKINTKTLTNCFNEIKKLYD